VGRGVGCAGSLGALACVKGGEGRAEGIVASNKGALVLHPLSWRPLLLLPLLCCLPPAVTSTLSAAAKHHLHPPPHTPSTLPLAAGVQLLLDSMSLYLPSPPEVGCAHWLLSPRQTLGVVGRLALSPRTSWLASAQRSPSFSPPLELPVSASTGRIPARHTHTPLGPVPKSTHAGQQHGPRHSRGCGEATRHPLLPLRPLCGLGLQARGGQVRRLCCARVAPSRLIHAASWAYHHHSHRPPGWGRACPDHLSAHKCTRPAGMGSSRTCASTAAASARATSSPAPTPASACACRAWCACTGGRVAVCCPECRFPSPLSCSTGVITNT